MKIKKKIKIKQVKSTISKKFKMWERFKKVVKRNYLPYKELPVY